jgi:hypothetical protein
MGLRTEFGNRPGRVTRWRLRFVVASSAQLRINFYPAPNRRHNGTVAEEGAGKSRECWREAKRHPGQVILNRTLGPAKEET